MARVAFVLAAAALLAVAAADCPNACSGNGRCSAPLDYCQCYDGFQGNDCSQRTCAFGLAWIDTPTGDIDHDNVLNSGFGNRNSADADRPVGTTAGKALNPMWRPKGWWERHPTQLYGTNYDRYGNAGGTMELYVREEEGHFYSECSSRGLCDRETGICQCFTGYEGAACNRTVCPNECSGHGVCRNLRQQASVDSTEYKLWDSDKNYGCVCDAEYTGADCSERRCYKNDDPLTDTTNTRGVSEKLTEMGEVQRLKVACANGGEFTTASTIKLGYTDVQFGETYWTGDLPVGLASDQSAAIQTALRGLPNDVLGSTDGYDKVTVGSYTSSVGQHNHAVYFYSVTFHKSLGNVPLMTVNSAGMSCRAGWKYPSSYYANNWIEIPDLNYDATTGSTMGPTVDLTVTLQMSGTANSIQYVVEVNAAHSPVVFTAAHVIDISGKTGVAGDYLDTGIKDLLPMLWNFRDAGDDTVRGSTTDPEGAITIQFTAGAADVTVITPYFDTAASSLPLQYAVAGNTDSEFLFLEHIDPFDPHDAGGSSAHTINFNAAQTWQIDSAGTVYTVVAGWKMYDAAVGFLQKTKLAFSLGTGARNAAQQFKINYQPGYIQGGGDYSGDSAEILQVINNGATRAIEQVDIKIVWAALQVTGAGGGRAGTNTWDWYSYTLNGVEMGIFPAPADATTSLGDSSLGRPSDISTFYVSFAGGVSDVNRASDESWYFSLVRLPAQASWGYQETFRGWYFKSDTTLANRLVTPTASDNFGLVINWMDISGAADKYRWKLSTDEVWMDNSGNGYTLNTGVATETGELTTTFRPDGQDANKHGAVANYAFSLSGGIDSNLRACDDSVNAYLYIQFGYEGRNDFNECSDRGLCNVETGECECFKGYKGTDCSIQSALAF